jgi:hypothetical protein
VNFQYYNDDTWSRWRYARAYEILHENEGNIPLPVAMDILRSVAANFPSNNIFTMWSAVYNQKTLDVDIVIDRNYTTIYHFSLSDLISYVKMK